MRTSYLQWRMQRTTSLVHCLGMLGTQHLFLPDHPRLCRPDPQDPCHHTPLLRAGQAQDSVSLLPAYPRLSGIHFVQEQCP